MFQTLFLTAADGANYTNYFNVESTRGIELICLLSLLGALIIANAIVFALKREKFALSTKISLYTLIAFSASIVIANIVMSIQDGTFSEIDCRGYIESIPFMALTVILTILLSLILIVIPFIVDKEKHQDVRFQTRSIAYAGLLLALAFGLSYIRLFKGPYGGSITVAALLPVALYSYIFGCKKGTVVGVVFGLLQFIQDPYFYHILQFFLDYILAFGFVGLCGGIFKKIIKNPALSLVAGIGLGITMRFISHFISGAVFFGAWMPENFASIWTYSFVYNISYVLPDGAIAMIFGYILLRSKLFVNQINKIVNPIDKAQIIDEKGELVENKTTEQANAN